MAGSINNIGGQYPLGLNQVFGGMPPKPGLVAQDSPAAAAGEEKGVRATFSPEALSTNEADSESSRAGENEPVSEKEQRALQKLKQRDAEVRRHEQAHLAAGGAYVRGGASFTYTSGPDNRQYATGGEVSIDVSPSRTPESTIVKAQVIRRAALAPADPSPQDRAVAAQASRMETEARAELSKKRLEQMTDKDESAANAPEIAGPAQEITAPARLDLSV